MNYKTASYEFVCVWGGGSGGLICLSTVRTSSQGTRTPPLQDKHIPVSADEVAPGHRAE